MPLEAAAAIPAALNFLFRGVQAGYEIAAAPRETSELIKVITQVKTDIKRAKGTKVELSKISAPEELVELDAVIADVEASLASLEKLVEPTRANMQLNNGQMSAWRCLVWTLRDSNMVLASSSRLTLAHQRFQHQMLIAQLPSALRNGVQGGGGGQGQCGCSEIPPAYHDCNSAYMQTTLEELHKRRLTQKPSSTYRVDPIRVSGSNTPNGNRPRRSLSPTPSGRVTPARSVSSQLCQTDYQPRCESEYQYTPSSVSTTEDRTAETALEGAETGIGVMPANIPQQEHHNVLPPTSVDHLQTFHAAPFDPHALIPQRSPSTAIGTGRPASPVWVQDVPFISLPAASSPGDQHSLRSSSVPERSFSSPPPAYELLPSAGSPVPGGSRTRRPYAMSQPDITDPVVDQPPPSQDASNAIALANRFRSPRSPPPPANAHPPRPASSTQASSAIVQQSFSEARRRASDNEPRRGTGRVDSQEQQQPAPPPEPSRGGLFVPVPAGPRSNLRPLRVRNQARPEVRRTTTNASATGRSRIDWQLDQLRARMGLQEI